VLARRLGVRLLGYVVGDDDARDRARRLRDADRAVDEVLRLLRRHQDLDELRRDVLEQRLEVDLLLVAAAERHRLLLADDRDDRLVVELGVVEAVQQVDRTGTGGGHADADLAGELRVGAGGERRDLLVAHLHELDLVADLVERAQQTVDAVAGVAVDAIDAPLVEAIQHESGDVF
jgi:hypothetical protein